MRRVRFGGSIVACAGLGHAGLEIRIMVDGDAIAANYTPGSQRHRQYEVVFAIVKV
jgi:hypothetical protein